MNTRLVYSTDTGSVCPECNKKLARCGCSQENQIMGDGNVAVRFEKKKRKGKGVTIISGLALSVEDLTLLAKTIKKHVGVGGSVKYFNIEIQGNKVQEINVFLKEKGFME